MIMTIISTLEAKKISLRLLLLTNVWQNMTLFSWNSSKTDQHAQVCYRKSPKFSDTQYVRCNHAKIQTKTSFHREICPKGANRMTNSVDPDQTAPLGAVCSGSALFAKACVSENLGPLWYCIVLSKFTQVT